MEVQIIDKVILEAHKNVLSISYAPSVTAITTAIKDIVDRQCYNIIYSDVNFNDISENTIHEILSRYRCVHTYYGNMYYDAQNLLFPDWIPSLKLLTGS